MGSCCTGTIRRRHSDSHVVEFRAESQGDRRRAARGKPLGPFVRSIDTNPWPDDKRLNRVIQETLAKAKDNAEVHRLKSSEHPEDVVACMRRELKDPYVFMPKVTKGGNKKKKARVAAGDASDQAMASSSEGVLTAANAVKIAKKRAPGDYPQSARQHARAAKQVKDNARAGFSFDTVVVQVFDSPRCACANTLGHQCEPLTLVHVHPRPP